MDYKIVQNEKESRFETEVEGLTAVLDYRLSDNCMKITHVGVPKPLEGRGIAAALAKTTLVYIRQNGMKIKPICPYMVAYLEKHPEYNDLLI